ncbi:MAG: carbohydrate binding domain-containing protein [Tepidisphaeraceae bacterium]
MTSRRQFRIESLQARVLLAAVPNPVGRWALDDGAGTNAVDATGNGHNATLSAGASWSAGNVGSGAMSVNGSSTGLATIAGPMVDTSASFTVSAWVKLNSLSGFQTVVSIAGTTVSGFYLQLRGDSGVFAMTRIGSDSNSSGTVASAASAPSTGTWYHLVGVNDVAAGTISLYVDGLQASTAAFTSSWKATGDTFIGHGLYGGNHVDFVNGAIDDVAFYNVALTADQVASLDNPATYPFDEGAGTTAADDSGHGLPLSLGAGAGWAAGKIGANALSLNGTSTSLATRAGAVVDTSLPFSVSAWVRLNSTGTAQTFVSIDGTNTSGFSIQFRTGTNTFAFARRGSDSNSATIYRADSTFTPVVNTWYHLLGVNDVASGRIQLYVNGQLQSSTNVPSFWKANGGTIVGGAKGSTGRIELANARIDDVRFFNSPLTSTAASWIPFLGTGTQSMLSIATQSTGITTSPDLFGLFMEDINYGGDGGVYNDQIRNGGFNDSTDPLNAWRTITSGGAVATLTSDTTTGPTTALTQSGKLTITSGVSSTARAGIANTGYFGVAVTPSTSYAVQFYAKASAGFIGPLTITLESTSGTVYATATIPAITTSWAKYTATLTTSASAPRSTTNRIVIATNSTSANGATLWIGSAHAFPPGYKNSPAHLRVDLMEKLAAMNPATFRVPGGNYLEGNDYANRFNWSKTIGPIENRPGHMNPWGYWSTDGMGLDEYLQMAELVGARPILGVFAGYTLNGTSSTGAQLTADVQDAINELHYVLDPVTTSWARCAPPTAIPPRTTCARWRWATRTGSPARTTCAIRSSTTRSAPSSHS